MEHSIYITVEEFLENGGVMNSGRAIYTENTSGPFKYYKEIGWFDPSNQHGNRGMISVTRSRLVYDFITSLVYLEISVTPIYQ